MTERETAHFSRLREAYAVLSDPKRRRLYDAYGELGLRWVGRVVVGLGG